MLEKKMEGDVLTITPTTRFLDAQNAADLQARFEETIDPERMVLLDLRNVELIDSSGLAAIISSFKMLEIRDELTICNPRKRVMHLFEMTNLEQVIRIFPDHEAALAALEAS